jgi:hypothetical protein
VDGGFQAEVPNKNKRIPAQKGKKVIFGIRPEDIHHAVRSGITPPA